MPEIKANLGHQTKKAASHRPDKQDDQYGGYNGHADTAGF